MTESQKGSGLYMHSNSKTISIVINARLHSTRIRRKMSRDFKGTTLLDITLSKFRYLFGDKYLAFCQSDEEIVEICQKYKSDYKFIFRDEDSVVKGRADQRVSFKHYDQIPTTHIF